MAAVQLRELHTHIPYFQAQRIQTKDTMQVHIYFLDVFSAVVHHCNCIINQLLDFVLWTSSSQVPSGSKILQ